MVASHCVLLWLFLCEFAWRERKWVLVSVSVSLPLYLSLSLSPTLFSGVEPQALCMLRNHSITEQHPALVSLLYKDTGPVWSNLPLWPHLKLNHYYLQIQPAIREVGAAAYDFGDTDTEFIVFPHKEEARKAFRLGKCEASGHTCLSVGKAFTTLGVVRKPESRLMLCFLFFNYKWINCLN